LDLKQIVLSCFKI